jgi:DNA polymerase-3 subunit delta
LPAWIERAVTDRGGRIARDVADGIAELAGPELAPIADAVERLCLYVGPGGEITEDAVAECVVRLRPSTVWELVGAVGRRDVAAALAALSSVYDPADRGLRLVGVLAWSTRQLIKFEAATRAGKKPAEAALAAGAPPFKARELANQLKGLTRADLARFVTSLCALDRDLKGGSRRPPEASLALTVLDLTQGGKRAPA